MINLTPKEKIARLEELLARVKTRAAAPRPVGVAPAPAALAPPPVRAAQEAPRPVAAAPAAGVPNPTALSTLETTPPDAIISGWSEPPQAAHDEATEIGYGDDLDVDVEVSSEVVEVDIDVDEGDMGLPAESGAQPVAEAAPVTEIDEPPARTEPSHRPPPEIDREPEETPPMHAANVPANEVVEPEPSSSPRPITAQPPEPYEEESAPRHTPPPESGKQVAVAPSAEIPRSRSSAPPRRASEPPAIASAPPPSLEGHTLVGGWREPGIPQAGGSHPGVRVPPPASPGSAPDASRTRLSPEVTRAELPAAAKVATFEGAIPAFKPASFGELLDATLGL